jgi:tRNA G18 (ribose-2'-O)-methylase SpoU
VITITDPDDPLMDDFRALRARESRDVLWAEGPVVVERLLSSGLTVRAILVSPAARDRLAVHLAITDAPVFLATQAIINTIVGFDLHRGAIAAADRPAPRTLDDVLPGTTRLVVVEGVNDPENLGAIARSARALGADAVVLDPTCADPYYRRSVRVSMGEMLHLAIARAPLEVALERLVGEGFEIWALTPDPVAVDIALLAVPDRLAVLVGAEGPGLSAAVLNRYRNVGIPMSNGVDSLNVAHAVAAALAIVQTHSHGQ